MGLDSVELVMEVEKYFGIDIPDAEAEAVRTVDDFAQCAARYISINKGQKCKSQMLFYVLRDYIAEVLNFPKERFMPSTLIGEVFPLENRKEQWTKMSDDLGLEIPTLSKRDLDPDIHYNNSFLFALFNVPEREDVSGKTIRDLTDWILTLNHERFIDAGNIASIQDIERVIIYFISEKCGIDVDSIQIHHKIANDLGID